MIVLVCKWQRVPLSSFFFLLFFVFVLIRRVSNAIVCPPLVFSSLSSSVPKRPPLSLIFLAPFLRLFSFLLRVFNVIVSTFSSFTFFFTFVFFQGQRVPLFFLFLHFFFIFVFLHPVFSASVFTYFLFSFLLFLIFVFLS